jgi:CubicO group peptidase (beta-lactamase class C family)
MSQNRINHSRRGTMTGLLACAVAMRASSVAAATRHPFSGSWSAFVGSDDPPTRLKLVIDDEGQGRLIVIDQGEITIGHLDMSPKTLRFELERPPISFAGELRELDRIVGICRRGEQSFPLVFRRGDLYTEPPEVRLPEGPLSEARLHALRIMARAPAMGVGWQFENARPRLLVDGVRAVNRSVRVTPSDQWHLGSVTKSMTATLVARCVDAGLLGWRSTVGDVLGTQITDMLPAYREVTVTHLLSHHGGLPRDREGDFNAIDVHASRLAYARDALRQPPSAAMGTQMNYSNADYVVAALMLETLAGKTWEELIQDQVFVTLRLRSAGFGPPGTSGKIDQPLGHEPGEFGLRSVRADIPPVLGPAGSVHMNLRDLLTYLEAHRDMPTQFLSRASWTALHTPPSGDNYALGWSVASNGALSHGGTNGKWKTEVLVDGEVNLVAASVANVLNNNTQSALLQLLASAKRSD